MIRDGYDELVQRLRITAQLAGVGLVIPPSICLEAADAIEELSRQKEYWISVYDRFPPAEKEVYVTDGEYIARANLLDDVFPGDKPCWSYSGLGEITHWCEQIPLPQPPKEET